MDIRIEMTPNPATLKFLPGIPVMGSAGTANFPSPGSAARSPLAEALFALDGVAGIFFGADFVTVAKTDAADWDELAPAVSTAIAAHFAEGAPVMREGAPAADSAGGDEDDEIAAQIRELIDTRVRPAVAMDGGDIIFQGFENGVVYLYMQGACSGCPSSTATLKMGIENMLKHYIPEVVEVRATA